MLAYHSEVLSSIFKCVFSPSPYFPPHKKLQKPIEEMYIDVIFFAFFQKLNLNIKNQWHITLLFKISY